MLHPFKLSISSFFWGIAPITAWLVAMQMSACGGIKNTTQLEYYGQDSSITVDGILDDWKHPLLRPAELTNVQYKAGNDDKHLFICKLNYSFDKDDTIFFMFRLTILKVCLCLLQMRAGQSKPK